MALTAVAPFNCTTYVGKAGAFIDFAVQHVQNTFIQGRTGWIHHLRAYSYIRGRGDWQSGIADRHRMHNSLRRSTSDIQLLTAINMIMDWGGLKRYSSGEIPAIQQSLRELGKLDAGGADRSTILAQRIAAASKIYAIHDLEKWTIYDSRAANALARLVCAYWECIGDVSLAHLLRFPQPLGKATKRVPPPCFPKGSSERQFCLAFVYASWLLRAIAHALNRDAAIAQPPTVQLPGGDVSSNTWKLYHVEMVLFMLGE